MVKLEMITFTMSQGKPCLLRIHQALDRKSTINLVPNAVGALVLSRLSWSYSLTVTGGQVYDKSLHVSGIVNYT